MTTHVNTSELLQSYIVRTYARDNWPASRTVVEAHDGSEAMAHVTAARGRAAYATAVREELAVPDFDPSSQCQSCRRHVGVKETGLADVRGGRIWCKRCALGL